MVGYHVRCYWHDNTDLASRVVTYRKLMGINERNSDIKNKSGYKSVSSYPIRYPILVYMSEMNCNTGRQWSEARRTYTVRNGSHSSVTGVSTVRAITGSIPSSSTTDN